MKWENHEQNGDAAYHAWVETKFEPGKFDGYYVRLAKWATKEVRAALTERKVLPSDRDFDCCYWDFEDGQWVSYTEGDAPGTDVPRGAFLDPHLDLLRDIEEPDARRVLSKTIDEAREAERSPQGPQRPA